MTRRDRCEQFFDEYYHADCSPTEFIKHLETFARQEYARALRDVASDFRITTTAISETIVNRAWLDIANGLEARAAAVERGEE